VQYTRTYDESAKDAIEPNNVERENEYSALPCSVEA
jgi:hypothetical protein